MTRNRWIQSLIVVMVCNTCVAQEAGKPSAERKLVGDYGPFLQCTVMRKLEGGRKREVVSLKGVVIKLPGAHPAAVCFDTDLLTVTAAWKDGHLDLSNTMMVNHKGTDLPAIQGRELIGATGPGLVRDGNGSDPRVDKLGPLPRDWGSYRGLYVHGERVVVSYSLAGTEILEEFALHPLEFNNDIITRTFEVGPHDEPLSIRLADWPGAACTNVPGGFPKNQWMLGKDGEAVTATLVDPQQGVRVTGEGTLLKLDLAPAKEAKAITVGIWRDREEAVREGLRSGGFAMAVQQFKGFWRDLGKLTKGGPARWEAVGTKGVAPKADQAYVVDRIQLPETNKWNSWMRLSAFDFFPDGTAAVSTLNGDVWLVTGLDESLRNVTWMRFATGLYEPMGLKIVDGMVHVLGRDQITRLHDTNNDGEADFYENFNNSGVVNPSYHGFAFELQTDSRGHFYYARTGHRAASGYPGHGCVIKVLNRSEHAVIATGLRAPNGLAVGPKDEIAVADNQGNWVPTTRLDVFTPRSGGDLPFLGYLPQHHRKEAPAACPPPMVWIPHKLDPSAGSAVWVTGDKWGPFLGQMAHTSFGRASLLVVLPDEEYRQAAVVRMPLNFDTGIMRAKFHPIDGQLYVAGVGGGWQAGGPRDGGFYRVRYTGKPVHLPNRFRVDKTGVRLSFPNPLDPKSAADPDNYGVEQWNYKWTEAYGSPEYSVEDPEKKERDEVEVKSVTLSEDRRSVLLELADFKPVMQMLIQTNIKAADGTEIETEVYATVNRIPE